MPKREKLSLKPRNYSKLPPKKLYSILSGIYPKQMADEMYFDLTGLAPPKSEETGCGLLGLIPGNDEADHDERLE